MHRLRTLIDVMGPLAVAVLLIAAVEGALRVGGFEIRVPDRGDPYLNLTPLFRREMRADGVMVMRRRDGAAEFLADKPATGFRVFVLGESSVHGFPYGPAYAFPALLQTRLAAALPGRVVEVVNAGVAGIASWHVRRIADELTAYRPDVVLVYTGHNDYLVPEIRPAAARAWLGELRFYQLAVQAGVELRRLRYGPIDEQALRSANQPYAAARARALGTTTLSATEREWIAARFTDNLHAIVRAARTAGAVPVVASLAQDLRDTVPGAWRHTPDLPEAVTAQWTTLAEEGDRLRRAGDCPDAVTTFETALRIDHRPAALHYALARCL